MADAVVSFAVERLGDLLISESKLLYGVRGQIEDIKEELKQMQGFLKEADKRQIQDERVRGWVDRIKVLAFRTEDVIEIFALQVATNSGFKEALRRYACISSHLISRHDVAAEIKEIKAKLVETRESLITYGVKGLDEGETSNSQDNPKKMKDAISFDFEKDFVGMEKEIHQLVSHLKKEDKGTEVVSILGMGGQGKTTLARKFYNHAEIRHHFDAFAWVCLSQQFDREKVLKEILKQLLREDKEKLLREDKEKLLRDDKEEVVSNMGITRLFEELRKIQQEKYCLIVIDDIWSVDFWSFFEPAVSFPIGETTSGCKILLTTRESRVAAIGSVSVTPGLTEDEGWQLLSKKAGIYDQPEIRAKMEEIGRDMVRRCEGLPLAISALGGILKGQHLLSEWKKTSTDISFYLAKGQEVSNDKYSTVRQVLGLSYDYLPLHLRQCFLCFANYKEDEIIETGELYMLWMAEGLISVEDRAQGEMMLDVAERYLDELAHRSLVKVETHGEGESWSKYKECVVHDLIQDLCLSKVKEQGVIKVIDLERKLDIESKASIVRRLCVRSYDANRDVLEPYDRDRQVLAHIRSLFIWNDVNIWNIDAVYKVWPDNIFSLEKFKLLRVLTARGYKLSEENVRSISELVYLKYLCLQGCELNILPSSIGKLRNLETLDVRTRGGYLSIPNVVWKLKMLKHLYLPYEIQVRGRAKKLRLEGLNEIELIYNFNSEYCDARDLLGLPNLKVFKFGRIWMEANITAETIIDFAKSRELRHSHIEVRGGEVSLVLLLECCFIDNLDIDASTCVIPKVYDYTRFSERLTRLRLSWFIFEEDPMILLMKLPNLRRLELNGIEYLGGGEIVCSAMSFLKLEDLTLIDFKGLRGWRVEDGAMPNLSRLVIIRCSELELLPEGLRHLTSLSSLSILDMPSRFTDKINVIDGVEGQDFYKVRHIPRVIF